MCDLTVSVCVIEVRGGGMNDVRPKVKRVQEGDFRTSLIDSSPDYNTPCSEVCLLGKELSQNKVGSQNY